MPSALVGPCACIELRRLEWLDGPMEQAPIGPHNRMVVPPYLAPPDKCPGSPIGEGFGRHGLPIGGNRRRSGALVGRHRLAEHVRSPEAALHVIRRCLGQPQRRRGGDGGMVAAQADSSL